MWVGSVLLGMQNADLCRFWLVVHLDTRSNQFDGASPSIMIHPANILAILVEYHLDKVSLSAL